MQSKVVHASLPNPLMMFQSRTTVYSHEVVGFRATKPKGAVVDTIRLKTNPGGAYAYWFDYEAQELHLWLKDGASVKAGKKANLVFSVTYEGQGEENMAAKKKPVDYRAKPQDVKLSVLVAR